MGRPIARLSSLQLTNIKNVKKGTIYMPNTVNKILSADKAEILGIYGQNGSGKTAIVDALYFLQKSNDRGRSGSVIRRLHGHGFRYC